jgi:hypothetical protein
MKLLKREELSMRKEQLINRLREWKNQGMSAKQVKPTSTSPTASRPQTDVGDENDMRSANLQQEHAPNLTAKEQEGAEKMMRRALEEQMKKAQAEKIVKVTQLVKEQCDEDLNKAIYELHSQMFLNSVQRQYMEEIERKATTSIEVLTKKHRRELNQARAEQKDYEKSANEVVDQLNDQMNTLNLLAMRRIAKLEAELEEARAGNPDYAEQQLLEQQGEGEGEGEAVGADI